jgi:hypothetical protein
MSVQCGSEKAKVLMNYSYRLQVAGYREKRTFGFPFNLKPGTRQRRFKQ